jgi:hypothetical protein
MPYLETLKFPVHYGWMIVCTGSCTGSSYMAAMAAGLAIFLKMFLQRPAKT